MSENESISANGQCKKPGKPQPTPEVKAAKRREYYERTKSHTLAVNAEYRRKHKEAVRAYNLKYRTENAEALKEWRARHYKANKPAIQEQHKRHYQANAAVVRAKSRAWARANPEKRRQQSLRVSPARRRAFHSRRKARVKSLPASFASHDMATALTFFGNACPACGQAFDLIHKCHWDHWIPLSHAECPGTVPNNMVPLCDGCNRAKTNRDAAAWLRESFGKKAKAIFVRVASFLETR